MKIKTRLLLEQLASWLVAAILCAAMFSIMLGCESELHSKQPCILAFSAAWCTACRADRDLVQRYQSAGWDIRVIDVDEEPALTNQYGVHSIPAYVVPLRGGQFVRARNLAEAVKVAMSERE